MWCEGSEWDDAGLCGGEYGGARDGEVLGFGGAGGACVDVGGGESEGFVGVVDLGVLDGEDGAVVEVDGGAGAVVVGVGEGDAGDEVEGE